MSFVTQVEWFEELPSTMEAAAQRAKEGVAEGLVVAARRQTAGRGRLGRTWYSPEGGLWMSLVLRPELAIEKLGVVGLGFAVAAAEAIEAASGVKAGLKWPNDLVVKNKKLGGILLESKLESRRVEFVILGLGLNVNIARDSFADEIGETATSLSIESGKEYGLEALLEAIVQKFAARYGRLSGGGAYEIIQKWNERDAARGRVVRGRSGGEPVEGIAAGIDADGALLVLTSGGLRPISSGEVEWL